MTQNLPTLTKSSNIIRTKLVKKFPIDVKDFPQIMKKFRPKSHSRNEMKQNEPELSKVSHR